MGYRIVALIVFIGIIVPAGAMAGVGAEESPSLVVHFENGKAVLGTQDKARLRELVQHHVIGPRSRIFILGYSDSRGDVRGNHRLSQRRAQNVRQEFTRTLGIDAAIVTAMGKGEAQPVADNRKARGRARNRRAEIYLTNAPVRKPERSYGPEDPYLPSIRELVREADTLTRQQHYVEAIHALDKARALGGDHYPDWQTTYGIAGYYLNAPIDIVHAHLAIAVRLDPYNSTAREFLGRVQARRRVAAGEVADHMGRTPETAIAVTAVVQEHEYLRLFHVEPLRQRKSNDKPMDIWTCRDSRGAEVDYYFNRGDIYAWAFAPREAAVDPPAIPAQATNSPESSPPPLQGETTAGAPHPAGSDHPSRPIWESEVFR